MNVSYRDDTTIEQIVQVGKEYKRIQGGLDIKKGYTPDVLPLLVAIEEPSSAILKRKQRGIRTISQNPSQGLQNCNPACWPIDC